MSESGLNEKVNILEEEKIGDPLFHKSFLEITKKYESGYYFQDPILKLMIALGAAVNNLFYKQQRYFRTFGLIKKISTLYRFISKKKVEIILKTLKNLDDSLKKSKFKMKHNYKNPFIQDVENLIVQIDEEDFKNKQEDLIVAFISGYNLYSKAVSKVFSERSEKPEDRKEEKAEKYEILLNYPNFKENESFIIGYFLGLYYFKMVYWQKEKLKTLSLIKHLHTFLGAGDLRAIKKILHQVNLIVLKVFSIKIQDESSESTKIHYHLPYEQYQINLFQILNRLEGDFDSQYTLLGFGAAFSILNDFGYLKKKAEKVDFSPERVVKNGQIIITEDHYLKYYKEVVSSELHTDGENLAFLSGILLNSLIYEENRNLGLTKLKKSFSFPFRNLNQQNILKLQNMLYHTLLSIWGEMKKKGKDFTIYPKIFIEILNLFGNLEEEIYDGLSSIALIRGFDSMNELYKIYGED